MKSTIGNQLKITLFGESHGPMIGAVVDGFSPGIQIDETYLAKQMELRKPQGTISTQRKEADEVKIVSGVYQGMTTGTPLCVLLENTNHKSKDYEALKQTPRPSHADYTAQVKYLGYQDPRGGGHFSGRLTAPLVAIGAICRSMLNKKGIVIASHIQQINEVKDDSFTFDHQLLNQMNDLNQKTFATISDSAKEAMIEVIEQARLMCDSVGGILETVVSGLPAGVGEPYFHSTESTLSHYLFSIGGVKGVEFGLGFEFAKKRGSEANDAFFIDEGIIKTRTNHNGGINGGITNGMPLVFRSVIKPTPSIAQPQQTVNMFTKEECTLSIEGRHDPCIVHRARVVVDSVVAIALVDLLMEQFGKAYFQGE